MSEFVAFPKISRLFRDIIISEKIDGTNPEGIVVYHNSSGQMFKVTLDNNDRGKWESNV